MKNYKKGKRYLPKHCRHTVKEIKELQNICKITKN